jgi:hypothetical protein
MAVSIGSKIEANDFNLLRTQVNRWFADNYAGSITFGNPNQTYGWGGSAAIQAVAGNQIMASEMNELINRCNIGVNIVDDITVAGPLTPVVTGNKILANDYIYTELKSNNITSNRTDIKGTEMSLVSGGNSQKTIPWGAGVAINCTFRYTFASFDKARYFFNSGGAIVLSGLISGYSTGTGWDGAGFDEILTNMGSVIMNHTATTQTGTGGTPSSTGYYDLGTSYTNIFSQTGSGVYSDATLVIAARYGSSGAYVEVRVTMTPGAGRNVNGTTTIYTQPRKLNNQNENGVTLTIDAPVYSLIDPL